MAGIQPRIKANPDALFAQVDAFFADARAVAAPRAINRLGDQAKTAGFRKIAEIYEIGPRKLDGYATVKRAGTGDASFVLTVKGKGFPIADLQPRQTKLGVSFRVKRTTHVILHAFLAKLKNGHIGVFARGAYGGKGVAVLSGDAFGRFQFMKGGRLPINELFSFAPPDTLRNEEVLAAMNARVAEQASKVFAAELKFAGATR